MQTRLHKVLRVEGLTGASYVLWLEGPFSAEIAPGQFAMLRTGSDWPVLLPRPFSYFDVSAAGTAASFFGKAIGPGTRALAAVRVGDEVSVSGPLGGGFPAPADGEPEPVCIAGGVGLAPFLLWTKQRATTVLYGGANREAIVAMESFPGQTTFHVATDDGSLGFHGNVLELYRSLVAAGEVDQRAPVYCCGPDPMMEAVAADCAERGVACRVSLETYLACGYGVCNGCSVAVEPAERFGGKPWARCCIHGPVFDAAELKW